MPELPSLKGRWFAVGLCCACWDRLNPDRKLEPERRASIEAELAEVTANWDAGEVFENRCAVCEETAHAGIFVRSNLETLRAMRLKT